MARFKSVRIQTNVGCGEVRSRLWNEAVRKTPLLQGRANGISPQFIFDRPYAIQRYSENEAAGEGVINIFTDGSKKKDGAGCGIYSRNLQIQYKWAMVGRASLVQTELADITIAAQEIVRRQTTGKTIRIYTDCRQSLLALRSYKIISAAVWECHQALVGASSTNNLLVCWVKGHAQCSGNKSADRLAKRAASLKIFGLGPASLLPISSITQVIKENTHNELKKLSDKTNSCRSLKSYRNIPTRAQKWTITWQCPEGTYVL